MRIHFIAVGGAVMHNLAIALHKKGYDVSGSDDKIYDPASSNLKKNGIHPGTIGFNEDNITEDIDAIILGMHAKKDNVELLKAVKIGVKVFSFPEYLYQHAKDKRRVVIAGSHGKTTITSMIMHVLKYWKCEFDYVVGAKLEGFEDSVHLTEENPVIILEGDEYLSSAIHRKPKFLYYKPNIALLSGIAWDHINVFPTFTDYLKQFKLFVDSIESNGSLVYNTEDMEVRSLAQNTKPTINKFAYHTPGYIVEEHQTFINKDQKRFPVQVFGEHNLQNLQGAKNVCNLLGINDEDFYEAINGFKGADKRLQLLNENKLTAVYRDFAHSPSKLIATIAAVQSKYPERDVVACLELHTFSSLNPEFLLEYMGTMDKASIPIVYFNEENLKSKRSRSLSKSMIKKSFNNDGLNVFSDSENLKKQLLQIDWKNKVLLLMTSGSFNGLNFKEFADQIIYSNLKKDLNEVKIK